MYSASSGAPAEAHRDVRTLIEFHWSCHQIPKWTEIRFTQFKALYPRLSRHYVIQLRQPKDLGGKYNHFWRRKNDDTQLLQCGAFFIHRGETDFVMVKQRSFGQFSGAPFSMICAPRRWEKAKAPQYTRPAVT